MSGAKAATIISVAPIGGPVIGATSGGAAAGAATGSGVAAVAAAGSSAATLGSVVIMGGAIVIGTAAVVGTVVAAARAAELKYHASAVKKCRRKINDILQSDAIKHWATPNERATLQNGQKKLDRIVVPDDLSQARTANAQAAELLREAENAAKPARLRHEITRACENMRDMLSEGKHAQLLVGQQPLLSQVEQLKTEISRKKEMNTTAQNNLRREFMALQKQCQHFRECVFKFDELADYLDTIKKHDWAKDINVAMLDELANRPELTLKQISLSFAQLIKEADNAFDKLSDNQLRIKTEAQDQKLEELQTLRAETEQRQIKLQQLNTNTVYDVYCQDIISDINRLIKNAKHAQYNDDGNTVKECLSQFDKLTESLPETAQVRQQRAEQLATELAEKQDQIALNLKQLTELIGNLELPDSIQDDYEDELQDLETRMNNLSRANPDEDSIKQAEGLESDIEEKKKRLPILKMHYLARSLFKSLAEENEDFQIDDESLEELELEAGEEEQEWTLRIETESGEEREFICLLEEDSLKISLQVAPDDTLTYECRLNANGDITLQKTDEGYGESCEAFKKLRSRLSKVATAQGFEVRDEQGNLLESYQDEGEDRTRRTSEEDQERKRYLNDDR